MALLPAAEALKKLQRKIEDGGNMTKDEAGSCAAITAQMLFGTDEATRIKKLNTVNGEI